MKYTYIVLTFLLCQGQLFAQEKYGDTWFLGSWNYYQTLTWVTKDSIINKVVTEKNQITYNDPYAAICDKNGKLKFYSSGCAIAGSNQKIISNGTQINPGSIHDSYCNKLSTAIYPAYNNGIFLPKPGDSTTYYLFHTGKETFDVGNGATLFPFGDFYFSIIDDSGKTPKVTKKNMRIAKDTLSQMGPLACKHANGKDWWVVVPTIIKHGFYRALLTKDSVAFTGFQLLGVTWGRTTDDYLGQGVFSPDGSKYVRSDPFNGTYIYNFDRCTGLMSQLAFIDTLALSPCQGVAISQNSRYLYLSNVNTLHQFDLEAADINESKVKIGEYDGGLTATGNENSFYKLSIAPDDKIYMAATNSTSRLHVIHKPNEKGLACDFKQHDFLLLTAMYLGMPNYPNFRLGKKEGVICPPLVGNRDLSQANFELSVYPNPTNGQLHINTSIFFSTLYIKDITGREIKKIATSPYTSGYQINTYDMENGIYFISGISENGAKVAVQRFVVQHY